LQQYGASTNIGNQRENNEDSYASNPAENLWIVADGMGGLGFGEVASAITVYTISTMVRQGHGINQSIELSHKKIKEYAKIESVGTNMGTTLVLLYSQGSLYNIFWVGDSRAYSYNGSLSQITTDHSLIQSLVDQGELSTEEAKVDPRKSAITRALGVQELDSVRADSISEKWQQNQKILLCSDGLTDCVADEDIERIIRDADSDQSAVDALIDIALKSGGKDNITAVLVSAPDTISDSSSDTEVPADETAGWQQDDNSSSHADTHIMKKPVVSEATSGTVKMAPEDSPLDATRVTISPGDADSDASPIDESEIDGSGADRLLGDRYLLPLGLILAALLAWILMSGGENEVQGATQPQQKSTLPGGAVLKERQLGANKPQVDETGIAQKSMSETSPIRRLADDPLEQAAVAPAIERHFPHQESFANTLPVLQLGIYTRLAGAEQVQNKISELGLYPQIDKRPVDQGMRYAVVLGPYDDPVEQELVATTLNREKISYFSRSPNDQ
jgi:protein phosphatase